MAIPAGALRPLIVTDEGEILHAAYHYLSAPAYRARSVSWFEKNAQYIGMLYDFFQVWPSAKETGRTSTQFLADFRSALTVGTIQHDGSDLTGLGWSAVSEAMLSHVASAVRGFSVACHELNGCLPSPPQSAFLSAVAASPVDKDGELRGAWRRRQHGKLLHLAQKSSDRFTGRPRLPTVSPRARAARPFPGDRLKALLFEGCRRERVCRDYGNTFADTFNVPLMLAVTLLAGGGLRKSELFHAFVDDIRSDQVRLYDPARGEVVWQDGGGRLLTQDRVTFLAKRYGMRPRHRLAKGDPLHAGWKSMLMDEGPPANWAHMHWISPGLKTLFQHLHRVYIAVVRPAVTEHPFYFVSLSHREYGQPWTIGGFNTAFATALSRIGLESDARRGLCPHGLRHSYGQSLTDMKIPPTVIQEAMHHKSPASQLVYTRPTVGRVTSTLENAARRLEFGEQAVDAENTDWASYEWRCDPLKLFAPWNLGDR